MRRKRRFTWLPPIGSLAVVDQATATLAARTGQLTVPADAGAWTTAVIELTYDQPHEPGPLTAADTPLVDFIGQEYLLERIVGRFLASYSNGDTLTGYRNVILGAGFFVARADTTPTSPIGEAADLEDDYNPLTSSTAREPWLWHRTWILSNNTQLAGTEIGEIAIGASSTRADQFPNADSIDTNSRRIVGNDDRLWFAMGVTPYFSQFNTIPVNVVTGLAVTPTPGRIDWYLDYRLLGQLRRAKNSSSF